MIRRLEIPRAYQAINRALEDDILSGRLEPGQPLPTETEMAQQFGVNRHTVREGIRVLEQNGFVKREAGKRLYVTSPRTEELGPQASRALLMQRVTFRELWEVALNLETCTAVLAVDRISDDMVEALKDNVCAMEQAIAAGESIIQLDVRFHAMIAEAADNRALLLAREPISLLFYPSLDRLFQVPATSEVGPRRLLEAHRHLVRAFAERDRESVHRWMNKHMVDFRRGYEFAGLDIDKVVDYASSRASPALNVG